MQVEEGGNFSFLSAKFPLPSAPSLGECREIPPEQANLPRQAAVAPVPPCRGMQEDAPSPQPLLTLTNSFPLYLTRIRGSWITSRLEPVMVRGVCPLWESQGRPGQRAGCAQSPGSSAPVTSCPGGEG